VLKRLRGSKRESTPPMGPREKRETNQATSETRETDGKRKANREVRRSNDLGSEMVGNRIEFVQDFWGDGSLSGNRYEGQGGSDESVLDEILAAIIVQKTSDKLHRTVHLVSPHFAARLATGGRAALASMLLILRFGRDANNAIAVMSEGSNRKGQRRYCAAGRG
jgi:hypothetical protein